MKRLFALFLVLAFAFATPTNLFAQEKQQKDNFFKAFPAIAVSEINALVKDIDELDFRPLFGIGIRYMPLDKGQAHVVGVMPGKPADLAGIRKGDVILAVNGQTVATSDEARAEFRKITASGQLGQKIVLELSREGAKVTATMVTVRLRDDRTAEAKRLRETIIREGDAMLAKMRPVLAEAAKAFEAVPWNKDDPRFKAAMAAVDEYDSWAAARSEDIYKLLELK